MRKPSGPQRASNDPKMRQHINEADIRIHFGLMRQRRQCGRVDACQPQIGCDEELVSAGGRNLLRNRSNRGQQPC